MDQIAKEWDDYAQKYSLDPLHGESRTFVDEVILKEIGDIRGKKILDVGCGNGDFTYKLFDQGGIVEGVDVSDEMQKKAQDKYPNLQFSLHDFATEALDTDKKYNFVVAELVVMFVKDVDQFLANIAKVLDENGVVIIVALHPFFVLTSSMNSEATGMSFEEMDDYFVEKVLKLKVENVDLTYFSRSVSWYVKKFVDLGYNIESLAEPEVHEGIVDLYPKYQDLKHLPYLLTFKLTR